MNMLKPFIYVILAASIMSCITQGAKMDFVRIKARYDLNCDDIKVIDLGNREFEAKGCEAQATYTVQCDNTEGVCIAVMNSDKKRE